MVQANLTDHWPKMSVLSSNMSIQENEIPHFQVISGPGGVPVLAGEDGQRLPETVLRQVPSMIQELREAHRAARVIREAAIAVARDSLSRHRAVKAESISNTKMTELRLREERLKIELSQVRSEIRMMQLTQEQATAESWSSHQEMLVAQADAQMKCDQLWRRYREVSTYAEPAQNALNFEFLIR